MHSRITLTASIAIAIALAGCAQINAIRYTTAEIAGHLILAACGLSDDVRSANLEAVNGYLTRKNHQAQATALDCDGDGSPDPLP